MNCPGDFYDYEENDSDHGHDNEDFDQENEETNNHFNEFSPLRPEQYYGLPWALEVGLFGLQSVKLI